MSSFFSNIFKAKSQEDKIKDGIDWYIQDLWLKWLKHSVAFTDPITANDLANWVMWEIFPPIKSKCKDEAIEILARDAPSQCLNRDLVCNYLRECRITVVKLDPNSQLILDKPPKGCEEEAKRLGVNEINETTSQMYSSLNKFASICDVSNTSIDKQFIYRFLCSNYFNVPSLDLDHLSLEGNQPDQIKSYLTEVVKLKRTRKLKSKK
jgi:hypothetical protein